jgi:UDP-N-acetylglucosamine diphosphorylase/glucosamine-1-phosphate N-acetyltransferase
MFKNILIFEDSSADNFYPFSITHCVWEIRVGALKLYEKAALHNPGCEIYYHGRENHLAFFKAKFGEGNDLPDEGLFALNARVVCDSEFWKFIKENINKNEEGSPILFFRGSDLAGVYIPAGKRNLPEFDTPEKIASLRKNFAMIHEAVESSEIKFLDYLWDALDHVGSQIGDDVKKMRHFNKLYPAEYHGIHAVNPDSISLGEKVKIMPGVVLDASGGAIVLGNNVRIMPQATIIGPCYIGDNSLVKVGAKIYEDTSIGEWCKVGGEIENTIFHSYSNKQHDGFLGHSYLGEWINLGADTNNSDLKNTYGEIKVRFPGREINTGRMFLGLLCGDHTKSGINSMFTTGTVAGICGILVKEWFLPNLIPSFTFGGKTNSPIYKFDKAIDTARIVMKRRNKELLEEEITLLREEYDLVAGRK